MTQNNAMLRHPDTFHTRHNGPSENEIAEMLTALGESSLESLIDATVPSQIKSERPLKLPGTGLSERECLAELTRMAQKNEVRRSYLGLGYHDTLTPPVILRNILENPGWYTQYTPYQAEIAQGRLELLLNFQTMVMDLTGLEIANASLLDEATAAAEAMALSYDAAHKKSKSETFFVAEDCHPQTIAVVQSRAKPLHIEVLVGDPFAHDFAAKPVFGALLQYPATDGHVADCRNVVEAVHQAGGLVTVACDLLALTLLTPPGEWGADIAVGNSQRFGVPLGYGGPHAAFFATREAHKRRIPGRIIGVSKDSTGKPALRMALQTREQHIRREKATSNICTAQVLLANVAAAYAIYHGPEGLRGIAEYVQRATRTLAAGLQQLGYTLRHERFFDTLRVGADAELWPALKQACDEHGINLRRYENGDVGVALDETVRTGDLAELLQVFAKAKGSKADGLEPAALARSVSPGFDGPFARTSEYLTHPVFHRYRSETELLRYLHKLEAKDLSLTHSMIPLGSCTMKLNATAEMMPISFGGFSRLHPFVPAEQAKGYAEMLGRLGDWLAEITGFAQVSMQPNSGAQGEYAGLLVIRAYHEHRGESHRNVCLIPASAHGTNPASAVMAGMKVVVVKCKENGDIDVEDLEAKAQQHAEKLAALMVTYPSTHGVFEDRIKDVCEIVHRHGGQVYLDGANMNAQLGVCRPAEYGADVCHLNLHKTFCIPHGGGGPGMGPIGVAEHLVPFLPGHPLVECGGEQAIGPISAAPFGSPSICTISYAYIAMMGEQGLLRATQLAVLNANYCAARLGEAYVAAGGKDARSTAVLYMRENRCAHEFILDLRQFEQSVKITAEDVAKRLMDYGYHAPTMSFPVGGTMMIEPTESESKEELDRFCDAMLSIREEIRAVEQDEADAQDNPLKHAPHSAEKLLAETWPHRYSREQAAFPLPYVRDHKFWPAVARVDNVHGDRQLICACPPLEDYEAAAAAQHEQEQPAAAR